MKKSIHRILTDREHMPLPEEQISGAGYLTLSAKIARTGIQDYFGHELAGVEGHIDPGKIYRVYRGEEEVFAVDALESFQGLPITLGHPSQEVTADNYKIHSVGHIVGQPFRDGDFIRAELTIRDAAAIAKIKSGEAAQLSVGYHADVHLSAGTAPNGQAYDAVQTNIRGNHIALVDAARCGPECSLLKDCACASCQLNKEEMMSDFVTLDGEQIPLAQAVNKLKEANARMSEALKDAEATIETLSAELETKSGEVEALTAKDSARPAEDADFAGRVQARAQMLSEAHQILGDAGALSAQSDSDIRKTVINHIYGDGFASGASDHALIGMYRVAVRDAGQSGDTLNGRITISTNNNERHLAEARRNQRLASAWQKGA